MKPKWIRALALTLALLMLTACAPQAEEAISTVPVETTEATVPPTVPADGNPEDVTCKGSYSAEGKASAVAATLDGAALTNGVLNAFYWAAAADYRAAGEEIAPDFDKPLDTQSCPLDAGVNSWQQYFLKQALNNWHTAMALKLWGDAEGLKTEPAYNPSLHNHEKYLTDKPAMEFHYSRNLESFHPNTLHQAYLDGIPELLETLAEEKGYADGETMAREAFGISLEDLEQAVDIYNRGYMYFTSLSYEIENNQELLEELPADQEDTLVNLRHILLVPQDMMEEDIPAWKLKETQPQVVEYVEVAEDGTVSCSEEAWEKCRVRAESLLSGWLKDRKHTEATFGEMARKHSDDPGTLGVGGAYRNLSRGQLKHGLDEWCFDPDRNVGDTTILRSEYGYHILYFSGYSRSSQLQEEAARIAEAQAEILEAAREKFPMEVRYEDIVLTQGQAAVAGDDLLYPDVAHERFPEAPLYLQQDYVGTWYGGFELRTNGCGITTLAMLATYMTDTELSPPEMCARYGNTYSFINGTDGRIFQLETPGLGFYCREKTYEPRIAKAALQEGCLVVSLQHKGYWTGGGHYLLLEKMNEDGTVVVRDSNIFNFHDLTGHLVDGFNWNLITTSGSAYWIFEKKATVIPACNRCGTEDSSRSLLEVPDYLCNKCSAALLRRGSYRLENN